MKLKTPQTWVTTKVELCELLGGISRATLDRWIKNPTSPKTRPDGRYSLEEWLSFSSTMSVESSDEETVALKLRSLKQKIELDDIKILKESGDLVAIDAVKQLLAHWAISAGKIIWDCEMIPKDVKQLVTDKIKAIDSENFLLQLHAQLEAEVASNKHASGDSSVEQGSTSREDQLSGMGETQVGL